MSDISFQVHYIDENGDMRCLNRNFYDEGEAQDAVVDLFEQGISSAYYDSIDDNQTFSYIHRIQSGLI